MLVCIELIWPDILLAYFFLTGGYTEDSLLTHANHLKNTFNYIFILYWSMTD